MNDKAIEIFNLKRKWAVIGVTDDVSKYGYKVYARLKKHNKVVYGVNPKYDKIDDDKIYPSLEAINDNIDVVVFIVNPKIGINYLESVVDRKISIIWLQPETESPEILLKAKENNIGVIEACVLLVSNYINGESEEILSK